MMNATMKLTIGKESLTTNRKPFIQSLKILKETTINHGLIIAENQ
jgi:hypothetical protein